jgi:hypothetical protein
MEYLSAFYPKHDVTLIIIQNALDHSADPVKGILEALQSLQVNGILYLNHHPNEAEFENYRGFHQFNITLEENDDLIIWNKKNRFNINELFSNYISIENKIIDNNVISILRKIADIPQNYLEKDNDIQKRHNKRRYCFGNCIKWIANNEKPVEKVGILLGRSVICIISDQCPRGHKYDHT